MSDWRRFERRSSDWRDFQRARSVARRSFLVVFGRDRLWGSGSGVVEARYWGEDLSGAEAGKRGRGTGRTPFIHLG